MGARPLDEGQGLLDSPAGRDGLDDGGGREAPDVDGSPGVT